MRKVSALLGAMLLGSCEIGPITEERGHQPLADGDALLLTLVENGSGEVSPEESDWPDAFEDDWGAELTVSEEAFADAPWRADLIVVAADDGEESSALVLTIGEEPRTDEDTGPDLGTSEGEPAGGEGEEPVDPSGGGSGASACDAPPDDQCPCDCLLWVCDDPDACTCDIDCEPGAEEPPVEGSEPVCDAPWDEACTCDCWQGFCDDADACACDRDCAAPSEPESCDAPYDESCSCDCWIWVCDDADACACDVDCAEQASLPPNAIPSSGYGGIVIADDLAVIGTIYLAGMVTTIVIAKVLRDNPEMVDQMARTIAAGLESAVEATRALARQLAELEIFRQPVLMARAISGQMALEDVRRALEDVGFGCRPGTREAFVCERAGCVVVVPNAHGGRRLREDQTRYVRQAVNRCGPPPAPA